MQPLAFIRFLSCFIQRFTNSLQKQYSEIMYYDKQKKVEALLFWGILEVTTYRYRSWRN